MYLLLILKIPKELSDELAEELYLVGNLSWETEEKEEQVLYKFYFPITLPPQEEKKLSFLEDLSQKFSEINLEYTLVKRENWEVIWKYHFKPLRVGEKLIILPPWEEEPIEEDKIILYIHPGQAFGTGHHPTTQLMLENLELYLKELCKKKPSPLVLDMGCGTGILSVATAKLCPKAIIYAIDIDELALEATQKNAKLNQISSQLYILKELPKIDNLKFDLILANIGTRELKNLAQTFQTLSKPGETLLLLSGILKEDLWEIENYYKKLSFKSIKTQFLKEWSFIAFQAL